VADATHDYYPDDGFHEIHLSGKQLVFLFMATTVVSVVIFLCGVWVGRGVRAHQAGETASVSQVTAPATPPSQPAAPVSDSGPEAIEPPEAPAEGVELSYKRRLDGEAPREVLDAPRPAETTRTPSATTNAPAARGTPPRVDEPPPTRAPARTASAATPAAAERTAARGEQSDSWVVQVHALKDRGTANGIVQRLAAKGYPAFLVSAGPPTNFYRVQVGRFKDKDEAERTLQRLKKEEKFEPWITR